MRKLISLLIIATLAFSAFALNVSASVTTSSATSASTVYVGENVTVTFTLNGSEAIAGVEGTIGFSSDTLTYVSGTSSFSPNGILANKGADTLTYNDFNVTSESKTYTIKLVFTAKKVGDASVTFESADVLNANTDSIGTVSNKKVTLSVKAKPTEQLSSNCNLKSLTAPKGCTLVPAFSSNVTEYTCTVPYSVTKFPLDWAESHSKANATASGNINLSVGKNVRKVKVTAQDGTTKTYTVTITRLANTETPQPTAEPTPTPTPVLDGTNVLVGGNVYTLVSTVTLEVPENASLESINYQGKEVQAVKFGEIYLVQLYNGETDDYFIYSASQDKFYEYADFKGEQASFKVLGYMPAALNGNSAFIQTRITVSDTEYYAWTHSALEEGYYVINVQKLPMGETYAALYCSFDGSVQKLSQALLTSLLGTTATPTPNGQTPQGEINWKNIIVIGGIALAVIIVVIIIILVVVDKRVTRKPTVQKRNWNLDNEIDPYDNFIEEEPQQDVVYRNDDSDFE